MQNDDKITWELWHYNEMPSYNGGSYGHVNFRIMPVKEDGKPGYSDTVYDGIYANSLELHSQTDGEKDKMEVYAYCLQYSRPYSVDMRDAERMLSTLKKIQRGLDKLSAQIGGSSTYADYVARVAAVLKAKVVFIDEDKYAWKRASGECQYSINNEIEKVWKACRKMAGKSEDESVAA